MGFASYLGDFDVDAETTRVLDVALERTRAALGLADDFVNGIIARQIVELARAGERNPNLLCEGALKKLRGHCSETNEAPSKPGGRFRNIQVHPKNLWAVPEHPEPR
jgi:hypothetical protein